MHRRDKDEVMDKLQNTDESQCLPSSQPFPPQRYTVEGQQYINNNNNIDILNNIFIDTTVKTFDVGTDENQDVGDFDSGHVKTPTLQVDRDIKESLFDNQQTGQPTLDLNPSQQNCSSEKSLEKENKDKNYSVEYQYFLKLVKNRNHLEDGYPLFIKLREKNISLEDLEQAMRLFNHEYRYQKDGKLRSDMFYPRIDVWLDESERGYVSTYLEKIKIINESHESDFDERFSECDLHGRFRDIRPDLDELMRQCDHIQCRLISSSIFFKETLEPEEVLEMKKALKENYEVYEKAFNEWKENFRNIYDATKHSQERFV